TVMSGLARTPWRHEVSVLVNASDQHVRQQFPAGLATVHEASSPDVDDDAEWLRVQLRAEHLDWIPPLLAALDCPLVIEHPAELRDLVRDLGERLARSAAATSSAAPARRRRQSHQRTDRSHQLAAVTVEGHPS
ncbi:MAG: WYL domain-containing protein, partial [Nakamurella sp.]